MHSALRLVTTAAALAVGTACVDTDRPQDDAGYQATEQAPPAQIVDGAPLTATEVGMAQQMEESERRAVAMNGEPSVGATASAAASRTETARPDTTPAARPANTRRRVVIGNADVTSIGYDRGDPNAPVVMINFSDFGCPYCASFSLETYPELEREFVATGKVYYKHVPFVMGMFPNGQQAARASECAADQGKFWPMHDRIYETQRDWKRARDPWVPLVNAAVAAGLDTTAFRRCFNDHRTEPRTRRASNIASDLGVRATPSFVINDRPIEGALPLAEFRRILDAAVREATQGR